MFRRFVLPSLLPACCLLAAAFYALGQTPPAPSISSPAQSNDQPPTLEQLFPPSFSQSNDLNVWGWFSYLHNNKSDDNTYWNTDLSLGYTHHFGESLALTANVHLLVGNDVARAQVEQTFASFKLSDTSDSLLTLGKFNASIGVEPRNAWDRLTGSTSLLFGALPQDLLGVMLTQPLGSSPFTLKPFLTSNFQGRANLSHTPSAGLTLSYRPDQNFNANLTTFIGPGLKSEDDDDDEYAPGAEYDTPEEYPDADDYLTNNWTGPILHAQTAGRLYLADANLTWLPRPDLTLQAEALIASTGKSAGNLAWTGALLLANYDLTDRWRIFAHASVLNDRLGFITSKPQTRYETSAGVGFQFLPGAEIRTEYRHDFAPSDQIDSLSAHLTFSY